MSYYEDDPELKRLRTLADLPPISESPDEGIFRMVEGKLVKISSDTKAVSYRGTLAYLPGEDPTVDRAALFASDDEVWGSRDA